MSIKNEIEYRLSLKRMEIIFDSPIGSPEGQEADDLSLLIEQYEDIHYPITNS